MCPDDINLDDLARTLNILKDTFGDSKSIFRWLYCRHPDLGMRTPIDALTCGDSKLVVGILERMMFNQPS
jgi:uncharacterized protein (DUF2384 family)